MSIFRNKRWLFTDVFDEKKKTSPRRILILLSLFLSIILYVVWQYRDVLIFTPAEAVTDYISPKSKEQIAIEKYISKKSDLDKPIVQEYAEYIVKYSKEFRLDPILFAGLVMVESKFNRYAISGSGALGLTQVMPEWHRDKIHKLIARFGSFDAFNPEHSIALGAMVLAEYKQASSGRKNEMLLRYNGSLGADSPEYAKKVNAIRDAIKHQKV